MKKSHSVRTARVSNGLLPLLGLVVAAGTGCSQTYSLTTAARQSFSTLNYGDNGFAGSGAPICNPIGGNSTTDNRNGIQARLTYLPGTSSVISDSLATPAFLPGSQDVVVVPNPLFISQVYVPTVDFRAGFRDSNGNQLKDLQGNKLDEYFSIQAQAQIALNAGDAEGEYQFATISDDGSMVSIDPSSSGSYSPFIQNDGLHSNRMGCSSSSQSLRHGSSLPFQMAYFQGPRVRIALLMLWRKVSSGAPLDSACDHVFGDDDLFTQSTSGPKPTGGYQDLLNRGWSPVPAANFYLPNGVVNPCVGT